jgi:RNA polymerase sigma factor (sigma-70 family)
VHGGRELSLDVTRADVELWRKGGREGERAFERLWSRFGRALEVTVARALRDVRNPSVRARIDADDIVGDTMVTVLRKLDDFQYRGPGSFLGWMEAVAHHRVRDWIDYWEAGKRDPGMERALEDSRTSMRPRDGSRQPFAGPSTAALQIESSRRLVEAVAELPDRERRIVLLRTCLDAGWAEVAQAVGAPSSDAVRKEHAGLLRSLARRIAGTA